MTLISNLIVASSNHRLEENISYDTDPFQKLDLYTPINPSNQLEPLLIYVHGGAWRSGDKAEGTNQVLIDSLSIRFPKWSISTINYRLSIGTHPVIHPAHNQDVSKAVNFLLNRSNPQYDRTRIYLLGHSVGAFICLSISGILSNNDPSSIIQTPKSVIGLGLLDGIYGLRELIQEYPDYIDFVQEAIGPDGQPNDWQTVSPLHWSLSTSNFPISSKLLIIHSKDDSLLSTKQTDLFVNHLNQLVKTQSNGPKLLLEPDLTSVIGDHDELLGSNQLADRIVKWLNP
ncbi:putative Esterase/Lipase [Melampsora larici-populina 98AG31]|uniref:Putative Esterase/Lipase n=1 Tax=Melampsora larici-populina (strain 98AG31 / pathotype 3-4-7) TaxID=747676 RepID=F4RT84_MELLP|nr:putative Esterase/Lipase [Melampsora larici-populina 98AG31]EGG04464.1 putative Esterase/Lipase [Melampsora larici-populina 98AG31]